jgi:heat shock protein HtpX
LLGITRGFPEIETTPMWNQLKTIALFGILSALLVGIGAAFAPGQLAVFVALAAAMNLLAYFFSDRVVLAMYRAQPVTAQEAPELHAMVAELAAAAALPMPRVYLIPDRQPNAFATGRSPRHGVVAVTAGLLDALDERELRGVIAHELAHIKHRDILVSTVAAILASAISTVANVLSFGALFGGGSSSDDEDRSVVGGLLMVLVAPLLATLLQLAISRSRELRADEGGARLTGDPEGLARALIRLDATAHRVLPAHASAGAASLFIVNPFGALERAARWFSTHPSLEERVARLRALDAAAPRRAGRDAYAM